MTPYADQIREERRREAAFLRDLADAKARERLTPMERLSGRGGKGINGAAWFAAQGFGGKL